ncbi:MAG: histidinol dehydrogenase [Candidatus Bathyarchaeia archaeon]
MIRIASVQKFEDDNFYEILNRARLDLVSVEKETREIIDSVKSRGDEALFDLTEKFDSAKLNIGTIKATKKGITEAYEIIKPAEIKAMNKAAANIKRFQQLQLGRIEFEYEKQEVKLGLISRSISSVGVYAPGGKTCYPSSVLMSAIPAKVAGVERIILCSPPSFKTRFNPHILVAADIAEVDEIYCVGGAQAIAAMAYGTKTIKPVEKIVGPGNIYVNAAKQILSNEVAIDLPAGPSEILIIADITAKAEFVAADMLAQAEHDENATCILITDSKKIADEVRKIIDTITENMPEESTVKIALKRRGLIIIVSKMDEAINLSNRIAPEHLTIMTKNNSSLLKKIRNAGAIFLGKYSPVAIGDYSVGTNHVLPTGGYAKTYSGLSVRDFLKTISYVKCSRKGLKKLAETTIILADIEKLSFHSKSIDVRGI